MNNLNLGNELLAHAVEINAYANTHEGEYASRKTGLALGRLATRYSNIPIFASTAISLHPDQEGVAVGFGEFTGSIRGFTFDTFPSDILTPEIEQSGVVMVMDTPSFNGHEASASDTWRLNILPERLRHQSIEGFVIGIPLIEGQDIMQIGEREQDATVDSIIGAAEQTSEYSYKQYVQQARAVMGDRSGADARFDGARLSSLDKIMHDIVFKCPYIGEAVAVQSDYIRSPKPHNEKGFKVSQGAVGGILRKFIYSTYEDPRSRERSGDVEAVLYSSEVELLVSEGKMTPQVADTLPSTYYIPLSMPHVLATIDGIKN